MDLRDRIQKDQSLKKSIVIFINLSINRDMSSHPKQEDQSVSGHSIISATRISPSAHTITFPALETRDVSTSIGSIVSMALVSMMMSMVMSIMMSASTPTSISTLSAIGDDNPKLQLLLPHSSLLRVPSSPLIPFLLIMLSLQDLSTRVTGIVVKFRPYTAASAFHSTTRHNTSVLLFVSENRR